MIARRAFARRLHLAFVLIGTLALALPARSQDSSLAAIPPYEGYVTDRAHLFDDASRAKLEAFLDQVHQKTGAQFAVLTVDSSAPEAPEAYKTRVFQSWGIGDDARDDGLLLLVAMQERALRFVSVGVLGPRDLLLENGLPLSYLANRQLLCKDDEIGFRERESWHDLVAAPDARQPVDGGGRERHVAERRKIGALRANGRRGRQTVSQHALDVRGAHRLLGLGRERPEGVREVRQDPLAVQLVWFAWQGRQREIDEAFGRQLAVEHGVPQRHPCASPRQSVAELRQVLREPGQALCVQMELAVPSASTNFIGTGM